MTTPFYGTGIMAGNGAYRADEILRGMRPRTVSFKKAGAFGGPRLNAMRTTRVRYRPSPVVRVVGRQLAFRAGGAYIGYQAGVYIGRKANAFAAGRRSYDGTIKRGGTVKQATINRKAAHKRNLRQSRHFQKAAVTLQNPQKRQARLAARRGGGRRAPQLTSSQRASMARRRSRDSRGKFR
jgi:hypothetical protein